MSNLQIEKKHWLFHVDHLAKGTIYIKECKICNLAHLPSCPCEDCIEKRKSKKRDRKRFNQ